MQDGDCKANGLLGLSTRQGDYIRAAIERKLGTHNMRVSAFKAFSGGQLGFDSIPARIETGSLAELTKAERRIFRLLAHGWTIKQIAHASRPKRAVKTIDAQKCSLMKKLEVSSQLELVLMWVKLRIEFPQC